MTYRDMGEVEEANRLAGHHFFDADTKRFFRSRIGENVYSGGFFVTSEKGPNMQRRYTVRQAMPNGTIDTFGEFQQYTTGAQAHAAARNATA